MKYPWFQKFFFYQIHQKLNGIFECESNVAFARLLVLVFGDFYQLLPVSGLRDYAIESSVKGTLT